LIKLIAAETTEKNK